MKCLFVTHLPRDPHTAVFAYIQAHARRMADRGHEVEILTPEDFRALHTIPSSLWLIAYPIVLWRWMASRQFDLVIFHSYTGWVLNAVKRLRRRKVPKTITQFHGLEPLHYAAMREESARQKQSLGFRHRVLFGGLMPRLLRASCRRSDGVLCLNREEREYLLTRGWAAPERTVIVSHGIDLVFFADYPHRPAVKRLLFLGRWIEGKGTRYLVDAFDALAAELPGLELWCVGTRLSVAKVRAAFAAESRERVTVVPEAEREDVVRLLRDADVFLFPSLYEGFSLALLEAMASGLPIVTTPVGAARDLLQDGESALVVPVHDASAMVAAVRRLVADRDLRARIGDGARLAAKTYTWSRRAEEYSQLTERIGSGKAASSPA